MSETASIEYSNYHSNNSNMVNQCQQNFSMMNNIRNLHIPRNGFENNDQAFNNLFGSQMPVNDKSNMANSYVANNQSKDLYKNQSTMYPSFKIKNTDIFKEYEKCHSAQKGVSKQAAYKEDYNQIESEYKELIKNYQGIYFIKLLALLCKYNF